MQILAPVGKKENLIAALQAGADAVYLGGNLFSARASAGNFSEEELKEAISYTHGYNAKLYLTVNTLLKDEELPLAVDFVRKAWNFGVDAIIFQDPGLFYLVHRLYPEIELHASTQLSVHNRPMAVYFKEKGAQRLILARELSLEEIEKLKGVTELEVFVQGALCICYSGQCLMSSLIGGRSGNRGRCAQPCRLEYSLYEEDHFVKKGTLISPRELSLLDELPALEGAGVMSLKIEGRMRSPEYVYESVSAYRQALEGEVYDDEALKLSFSRQGFTKAYLHKKGGEDLISEFAGKSGIDLGTIERGEITLLSNLRRLDGVGTPRGGFGVEAILYKGEKVEEAFAGQRVSLLPKKYKDGDLIRKTLDSGALKKIKEVLQQPYKRKDPVEVPFRFKLGEPMSLGHLQGEVVQVAKTAPLSRERVLESLSKSDGPLFIKPEFVDFEEGFVPVKEINALRRRFLEEALEKRQCTRDLQKKELPAIEGKTLAPSKYVILREKQNLDLDLKGLQAIYDPFFKDPGSLTFKDLETLEGYFVRVPGIVKENVEELCEKLLSLKGVKGILTSNQGVFQLLKGKVPLYGDYKLNLMNSYGLSLYDELEGSLLSEELSKYEMRDFQGKEAAMIYAYGPQEMMVTEYCPIRTGEPCSEPCRKKQYSLVDRKDYRMKLAHDIYCRNHIYNAPVKNLIGDMKELRDMGYRSFVIELFGEENPQNIIDCFYSEIAPEVSPATRGHYLRGIE
ncbi:MAG: U32 family peptidase [Tissierellia bacterium]|nr:U32 family peptidase [Tissierellia bacterium]